ncbi:MAG: dipeptidase, partial [Thermoanaerobaculia bacterium]|nr:dipeptidase [Thermoanaerobaculia bacterium]
MRPGTAVKLGIGLLLIVAACGREPAEPLVVEDLGEKAARLAHEVIIVDTHVDYPYRQKDEPADISQRTDNDFDYVKAREGGLDAPFMSIYIPASLQGTPAAGETAEELIGMVETLEREHPDKFAIARSPDDVQRQFAEGLVSLPMGMENGEPIAGDIAKVAHWYERGIRYIGLAHSENNHLSDSSYATEKEWNGLSPFGAEVIAEMNRLGIMVDVSHLSDEAFDDIMEITRAPAIASHSSCRHFTPGWERNISDQMIIDLARGGGVVQINFGSAFLDQRVNQQSTEYWQAFREFAAAGGIESGSPEAEAWRESYWQDKERLFADVGDVADHIEHVVGLVGVDHVGLGSDFDGVGDSLPTGLKDVAGYPNLIRVLLERGYTDEQIEKICSGNVLRVWTEVERIASEMQ